jgi:hypothetical protein
LLRCSPDIGWTPITMRTSTGVGVQGGAGLPKVDARGRRLWSLEERHQIVAEALAPGASVAKLRVGTVSTPI